MEENPTALSNTKSLFVGLETFQRNSRTRSGVKKLLHRKGMLIMPQTQRVRLTEKEKRRYLQDSSRCPYKDCRSTNIVGDSIVIDCGQAAQVITCGKCSRSWEDIYDLISIEERN